jgi:hypothetical protein
MKQKNVTKTYRNGKAVFQMDYIVRIKPEIASKKFLVTEQRAQFKDEKIIFFGSETAAEKFYNDTTSVTLVNGVEISNKS